MLAIDHQIAQKLHACTNATRPDGTNDRAHDLVDLQILAEEEHLDLATIAATATRLFAARRSQEWPPTVVAHPSWDAIYAEAANGLDVIRDVSDAVVWANDFIAAATQGA